MSLDSSSSDDEVDLEEASSLIHGVIENLHEVIVGHDDAVRHLVTAVLSGGHLLIEDVPGVGKTVLARSFAESFDVSFGRVQFTPDIRPTDITGVNVYNQKTNDFEFRPGPVFANILLGDEINRAPPRSQAALLEAMEEKQVTVDGETRSVPSPFTVIATQNSVETDDVYELPLAQIDRFTKKIHLGYPDPDEETELLRRTTGNHPLDDLEAVATQEDLVRMRDFVSEVEVGDSVRDYITRLSEYSREVSRIGASPRASISLMESSQARAVLNRRDYVTPNDVKEEAHAVLSHRIVGSDSDGVVSDAVEEVSVPVTE
ncbi:AAA family ATPase [Halorutilales archaeon Cl-col2-1]